MIRVFHFDGDALFREAMREYCSKIQDVQYRESNCFEELWCSLEQDNLDVVLLDLEFEPQSELNVLKEIRSRYSSDELKIILLSRVEPSENVLNHMVQLGADYFIHRPIDLVLLVKRIQGLAKNPAPKPSFQFTQRQVQEICTSYFEQMGIPPHYKGYRYLMEGIWLVSVHPSWLTSVTQLLYPGIGQRFGVNGAQVERSMRYALDVTWEKGNVQMLYKYFPYVQENKGKPTNSAFIAKMVDMVALEVGKSG